MFPVFFTDMKIIMNVIHASYCRYDFKGIIDYIFHSADTMSALGVLGPIDPDWFRDNKVMGCPHPHIPSGELTSDIFVYHSNNKRDE